MRQIDASSIIHGWDNYPIKQFPKLWNWLAGQIHSSSLAMSKVAFDEVGNVSKECGEWLKKQNIEQKPVDSDILKMASSIAKDLDIHNDAYHPLGVDENDLLIIATSKILGASLISGESNQSKLPSIKKRYKIPAVCAIPSVSISCIHFLQYIKQSRQVF